MGALTWIAGGAIVLYLIGFRIYGRFLSRVMNLSDSNPTPAAQINDGQDYIPTRPAILLSQHFAAIAAVGPIAGPILAGMQYGWFYGLLWIVIGAILVGGVHDFMALIASVRHGARSIGEVMKEYLGPKTALAFSLYIWFSLIYVIVVFTDLTAAAFVSRPILGNENFGPGVATSSLFYLGLSILLGVALTRFRMRLLTASLIFIPAIFGVIALGQKIPIVFPGDVLAQQRTWDAVILIYCFFASIIPMWVLLQPRGFLGGMILYATFIAGIFGIFFGRQAIHFPALPGGLLGADAMAPPIFPILFTTIACGACSGFHGLVGSGTTSKQLAKESHVPLVGYGGMLFESLVAVIAMATLMILSPGSMELDLGPDEIYARGLAHFMQAFGIPFAAGVTFGKLAFATFIYDTLDVSTRLGRYVCEEMTGIKGRWGSLAATAITLAIPFFCVFLTFRDAAGAPIPLWKTVWPAFGASNQLLAALTLAGVTIWLKKEGRNWLITALPAVFMTLVSLCSLCKIVWTKRAAGIIFDPVSLTAVVLLILAVGYISNVAVRFFKTKPAI